MKQVVRSLMVSVALLATSASAVDGGVLAIDATTVQVAQGATELVVPGLVLAQPGDLLLMGILCDGVGDLVLPAGWTTLESQINVRSNLRWGIFYRFAQAEPPSYTVGFAPLAASNGAGAALGAFRNVDPAVPFADFLGGLSPPAAPYPIAVPTDTRHVVVAMADTNVIPSRWGWPSSMTVMAASAKVGMLAAKLSSALVSDVINNSASTGSFLLLESLSLAPAGYVGPSRLQPVRTAVPPAPPSTGAITFQGAASMTHGRGVTRISVPRPAGLTRDALVVVGIYHDFWTSSVRPLLQWTPVGTRSVSSYDFAATWLTHRALASEPDEWTFELDGNGVFGATATVVALTGVQDVQEVVTAGSVPGPAWCPQVTSAPVGSTLVLMPASDADSVYSWTGPAEATAWLADARVGAFGLVSDGGSTGPFPMVGASQSAWASATIVLTAQPAVDAGLPDAGSPDAGPPDAGGSDAGTAEDAGTDAGTVDDAGTADAGTGDDAGTTDDAGTEDAGAPDASVAADAGAPDAGGPDAATQVDAGDTPDAGAPDAGEPEMTSLAVGCGCQSSDLSAPGLLTLLWASRRRRARAG